MRVFFDLDGPILDVSYKYYRVYADIVRENGLLVLGKEEYWDCKRRKIPEKQILNMTGAESIYEAYAEKRKSIIEMDEYLVYDKLQDGAQEILENLESEFDLILVTLRTVRTQLEKELESFGLMKFFKKVLSSGADTEPRWKIKYELVRRFMDESQVGFGPHIMVGDTETDIIAGNELGFRTVAVSNGIRTREILMAVRPGQIIDSIEHFTVCNIFN